MGMRPWVWADQARETRRWLMASKPTKINNPAKAGSGINSARGTNVSKMRANISPAKMGAQRDRAPPPTLTVVRERAPVTGKP